MELDNPVFPSNRVSDDFQQSQRCSQNWGKTSLVTSIVALAAIGLLVTGLLAHFGVITTLSSAISYGFIGAGGGVLGLEILGGGGHASFCMSYLQMPESRAKRRD